MPQRGSSGRNVTSDLENLKRKPSIVIISHYTKFPDALRVGGTLVGGSVVPKEDVPPLERSQVQEML